MAIPYLAEPLPVADHEYAIIDRMRFPELPGSWPLIELVSPMLAPQAHLYPWLLPLHELKSGDWRQLMTELAQSKNPHSSPTSCLLLSSASNPLAVRNALVEALQFYDPQRNGHILRYYDPRVLFHLHWMLTPWQLSHRLPAREVPVWTFWLEGEWRTLSFPEKIACQPGELRQLPLEELQYIGQINIVLSMLRVPVKDLDQRQEISKKIRRLLEQSAHCQLPTPEDRITFALHGLQQREDFWLSPKMAAFLILARQTADFYRDETSNWDDARWLDMTEPQSRTAGWNN